MEIRLKDSIRLYDWQKDCLAAWEENGWRGIVHVITGAGKTMLALAAAAGIHDRPIHIRVIVPTLSLMYQWKNAITEAIRVTNITHADRYSIGNDGWNIENSNGDAARKCPEKVDRHATEKLTGFFCGEIKDTVPCKFTIYVVNSARHAVSGHILRDMKNGISTLLIADECHHYGSSENAKIFHFMNSPEFRSELYMSLGLSATPSCTGYENVLVPGIGREIYRYDLGHAGKDHRIPDYFIFQTALSFKDKELREYARLSDAMDHLYGKLAKRYSFLPVMPLKEQLTFLKDTGKEGKGDPEAWAYLCLMYERTKITIMAKTRLEAAEKILSLLGPQKRVIVFSERILQAEALHHRLSRTLSSQVGIYHSEMSRDARKLSLERFRYGETRILISCKALDEGIDVPAADAGIILSGTSVERQRIQRFGRLLRNAEGKESALLYYLHVRQSHEEWEFLPNLPCRENIIDMAYLHKEKLFLCGAYEELAYPFLKKINKDDPLYREYRRCLVAGEARPDWLMPEEILEQRFAEASGRKERNYWYVMKVLSLLRRKDPEPFL